MKSLIFLMSDERFNTLVMAGVAILTSIIGTITAIMVAGRRADKQNAEVVATVTESNTQVAVKVGVLAKEIDGRMTELKETIAAKSLAEGKLEGIAGEQERVADLIVEPAQVTEAMNGKDVREQIDKIEAAVIETQETLAEAPTVRPAVRKQIDKIEEAVTDDTKE